jgi:predicted phosphodiesterase
MKHDNSKLLIISDMHIPYNHPDLVPFLRAVKKKVKPTRVICVGDEVDKHAMSFHDSDPDLMSAGDELQAAIKILKPIYRLFPAMDIVDSNHGSMVYRKGKAHGIPRKYLRDYQEVLEAPRTWKWHNTLVIKLPNGQKLHVSHGMKKNGLKLAESMGMCTVQGHYHTEFNIQYSSSPSQLIWSLQVGCLIDDESLAFHYNKVTPGRPIIGLGAVIDGQPTLIPMILDKKGRWIGKL